MNDDSKTRDVVIGFFGWMLISNLLSFLLLNLNSYNLTIWFLTITAILALFFKKRTWVGIGVVTDVIINVVFWTIMLAGESAIDILTAASIPLPLVFLLAAN